MLTKPSHSVLGAAVPADGGLRRQLLPPRRRRLHPRPPRGRAACSRCRCGSRRRSGDDVLLSRPVRRVGWGDDGVVVEADGDLVVHARRVIMAVPPNLYDRIDYVPDAAAAPPRAAPAPVARPRHQDPRRVRRAVLAGRRPLRHRVQPVPARARGVRQLEPRRPAGRARRLRLRHPRRPAARARPGGAEGRDPRHPRALLRGAGAGTRTIYVESDWGSEEWTRGAYAASFDMGGLERFGADVRTPIGPDPLGVERPRRAPATSTSTARSAWATGSRRRCSAPSRRPPSDRSALPRPSRQVRLRGSGA